MTDYKGKKIVIIGLELTGLSCVNFLIKRGVTPSIMDTRISPPGLRKLPKHIEYYLGELNVNFLKKVDLVITSPGISLNHPALISAANYGVEIIGDIELFCREVQAPIIAITGSNGKSTVTTLFGEMAKEEGINVGIGGNIGIPALNLLNTPLEMYVLELSSFQLETTTSLRATVATILNVTEDHINRYPLGFKQYLTAKLRVYRNAKKCVINTDDALTIPFGINTYYANFGINTGYYHLHCYKDEIWLCMKNKRLLNTREMKIYGQHNYANALAALALADAAGFRLDLSLQALITFKGLPHCFETVLERNGVRWINDSKSTNINSTKAALNSLSYTDGTIHLLLGGDGKSANFLSLKRCLFRKNLRLYCFGQDKETLSALRPEITKQTETLEQAIRLLSPTLKAGDIVLLSPACASLDQFENFEQRGKIFTILANELG